MSGINRGESSAKLAGQTLPLTARQFRTFNRLDPGSVAGMTNYFSVIVAYAAIQNINRLDPGPEAGMTKYFFVIVAYAAIQNVSSPGSRLEGRDDEVLFRHCGVRRNPKRSISWIPTRRSG